MVFITNVNHHYEMQQNHTDQRHKTPLLKITVIFDSCQSGLFFFYLYKCGKNTEGWGIKTLHTAK